jgi:hypothetical protein
MPTALFLYVFTTKTDADGKISLHSPFKGSNTIKRNPERLAQSGLVPSITRRNVTFKAYFEFKKGELTTKDLKIIQQEVDRELRHEVGIGRSYRVWNNAFLQIPALKSNKALRDSFLTQIGQNAETAQLRYQELMTTGKISGAAPQPTASPTSAADAQKAAVDASTDAAMEDGSMSGPADGSVATGDSAETVRNFVTQQVTEVLETGEGSFVADDGDSDELANLIGGLEVREIGGRRTTRKGRGKKGRGKRSRRITRRS